MCCYHHSQNINLYITFISYDASCHCIFEDTDLKAFYYIIKSYNMFSDTGFRCSLQEVIIFFSTFCD